ncbi:MAG: BamA/TamA family outer membrane protein [Holosporaceae bacterium]|jgi:translocation and assembly module TamA|nr:BamA/TamA family outer membrane protein [Holosporaceae bacterium]
MTKTHSFAFFVVFEERKNSMAKKIGFLFAAVVLNAFSYEADLRDFNYRVDLILKQEQNIVEIASDMIFDSEIASTIKQLRTFARQSKPVSNMRALKDRIINDMATIRKKAHIMGFYGAKIRYDIDSANPKEVIVKLRVDLGTKFNLKLNVSYLNQDEEFNKTHSALLQENLRRFKASIEEIKSIIGIAVSDLQASGFFKPEILEKKARIDYATGEVVLNLKIDPGLKVFFSDVKIKSFPDISDEFIKNRIAWEKGELFDIRKVESTVERLRSSQIFSKIKIEPDEKAIDGEKLPMIIETKEEKKRAVEIGLLYSGERNMNFQKKSETQKKLKSIIARFGWTNFNTFGGGEKLSFIAEGTPMKTQEKRADYGFEVALSQPDVFLKNNAADYSASRKQELTNVFFRKSDRLSIAFSYPAFDFLLVKIGGIVERNYVDTAEVFFRNLENQRRYECVSIPLEFVIDRTDGLLNPTTGYRSSLKFSHMSFKKTTIGKLKAFDASFAYHLPLDDLKKTVLAFNILRRSIFGQRIDVVPVDKRIYAGGMSSVRGYANQMATEMVVGEEVPMGGKSSIEFNAEVRRRFSKEFGGVAFFDGAKVFQNKSMYDYLQTEKKRWFYSWGIGVRYYSGIGPIRVDFAFPVKRRRGIDSKMQFVISLGQAF